jgi:hypothetical protein
MEDSVYKTHLRETVFYYVHSHTFRLPRRGMHFSFCVVLPCLSKGPAVIYETYHVSEDSKFQINFNMYRPERGLVRAT